MKKFEERLSRLEDLSEKLRDGDILIEEATAYFEEGIALAKGLEKDLSRIERKVEILVNEPEEPDEEPNLELFPEVTVGQDGSEPDE
jgi:exodeoxyribonuclease VII small subunit